jgi:hypothetical protein
LVPAFFVTFRGRFFGLESEPDQPSSIQHGSGRR